MKFIYLLLLSYTFSEGGGGYTFMIKYEPGEIIKYKSDSMMSFEAGGRESVQGSQDITIQKVIGVKDGYLLIEETVTDMIAVKKTLDKTSADHSMNQLVDIPYILHIDSSGKLVDISTEHKQFENELKILKQGMNLENYIYPFGEEAVNVSIGDKWTTGPDTMSFYMGDGGMKNTMIVESQYTLKKIKMKKGHQIATLSAKHNLSCSLKFLMANKLFEGVQSGVCKSKFFFDIDMGKVLVEKLSGSLKFDFTVEDKSFTSVMSLTTETRKVK